MPARLTLTAVGKRVDEPVDRLIGGVGVRRRKGQVARLRDAEGRLDGLEVPELADEHDIGILAEGGAQGGREAGRIVVDLALIDERTLVSMDVFDRIFDGEDVRVPLGVDPVDQGRQRGALSRPRRSRSPARGRGDARPSVRRPAATPARRWLRTVSGTSRYTAATAPPCLKTLQRNRASPLMPNEQSSSRVSSNRFFWPSVNTLYTSCRVSAAPSRGRSSALSSPSTRTCGAEFVVMCRSEPSELDRGSEQVRQCRHRGVTPAPPFLRYCTVSLKHFFDAGESRRYLSQAARSAT